MKFKVGDKVRVVKKGKSFASCSRFGQSFTIKYVTANGSVIGSSKKDCGGFYADELEHDFVSHTKLYKALK